MKHLSGVVALAFQTSVLMTVALMSACALPQTTVRSGSDKPGLIVKGAPIGSILSVDGLSVGAATDFDGNPKVLTVLEGVHNVEVRLGATVILSEKAFVNNGETHTVTVVSGDAR
jgi:hypothetical protein